MLPARPTTPEEFAERGNPNLDSDTNTVSSYDPGATDQDFLLDSPSKEASPRQPIRAPFAPQHQPMRMPVPSQAAPPHSMSNQTGFNMDAQGIQSRTGDPFDQAQLLQLQLLSQFSQSGGLPYLNQFLANPNLPNGALNLPMLNNQGPAGLLNPNFLQTFSQSLNSSQGPSTLQAQSFNLTSQSQQQQFPPVQNTQIPNSHPSVPFTSGNLVHKQTSHGPKAGDSPRKSDSPRRRQRSLGSQGHDQLEVSMDEHYADVSGVGVLGEGQEEEDVEYIEGQGEEWEDVIEEEDEEEEDEVEEEVKNDFDEQPIGGIGGECLLL